MKFNKMIVEVMAAVVLTLISVSGSFAADWAGTYMTEDTKGNAFTITLADGAKASGEKQGHAMEGTWSVDGDSAVIKWTTGWTTKLSVDGDSYRKSAYRPGAAMTDPAGNPTPAKKVE